MLNQDGLEWVSTTFGPEPRWTREPDMDVITRLARKHLALDEGMSIGISFYAQGAFNKLYKISTTAGDYVFRVSLPVYPHLKTESEVATTNFVCRKTDCPVPSIIAYDAENQNELGFEWILMEMMPGSPLRKRWRTMSWNAKKTIVRQLVSFQAQLFENRFSKIGNLYDKDGRVEDNSGITRETSDVADLGPMVSLIFLWGDHLSHDIDRGPFATSYEWLKARLQLVILDQERVRRESDDEDDIEDAEFAGALAEDLLKMLPDIFDPTTTEQQGTILFHDDLSMQNILVNDEGRLTAIIDWECVSAIPLWRACQLPQLLNGRECDECPERSSYGPSSDDENDDDSPDKFDNEGVSSLYWEHLLEYEQAQLRKLFMEEMARVQPNWVASINNETTKADFELAVHNCDSGWSNKIVRRWLNATSEGRVGSLADELRR
ncbi:hypothetical protein PG996_003088 [Apiospora saccharicola]|uniref:Aminoglycoside phosphotransferase domain-containing protein n=1 Tax=Apiospora saccharicola TaxID=335842 RepID=A0ABR1W0B7_9PEZI